MAEHRPTDTLLALIEKTLAAHPEGLAPRYLLDRLTELGENISRPTLNRLLTTGVEQGLWAPQGAGRSVLYTLGKDISHLSQENLNMSEDSPTPTQDDAEGKSTPVKKTRAKKASKRATKKSTKPINLHDQIRSVVWSVADTLRDKTGLQVETYQPVTLALLALKRNFDIQLDQQREDEPLAKILATELPMLKMGLRDPKDVSRALNNVNGFWDVSILNSEKFGLPLMTWTDLINFKDSDQQGRRAEPLTMILNANPEGHRTEDTALFTYTTYAHDLKALILEIIDSLVPDLREAFGAIGAHSVLGEGSEFAASLKNEILREICEERGTTSSLTDFDLSLRNVSVDVFSDTYMDLLGRFAEASGKRGGEYFTPTPLVNNALLFTPMESFAQRLKDDPTFIMRLADPTAGSNTFLVKSHEYLEQTCRNLGISTPSLRQLAFYAQELKNTQVGLGVFNMFYHRLASRLNPTEEEVYVGRRPEQGGIISRINGNTISEYVHKIGKQAGKIDLVVANPPYGTDDYGIKHVLDAKDDPQDNRWHAGVPTRSEGEWAFVQTIVDLLSPTGFATIVMPMGVLFRDGGAPFRQWLIEKDWLEGVIATPSNQFLTTSIPVCLLLLNKNKSEKARGGVYFVNATEDFTKVGKFNKWNEERSVKAWNARSEEPGYCGFVSTDRLRKAPGYSLAVNRWFSPIREKEVIDPNEVAQDIEKLRTTMDTRGNWLGGLFEQGAKLWVPPAPEKDAPPPESQEGA